MTTEEKQEVWRRWNTGAKVTALAKEFKVTTNTIYSWLKAGSDVDKTMKRRATTVATMDRAVGRNETLNDTWRTRTGVAVVICQPNEVRTVLQQIW